MNFKKVKDILKEIEEKERKNKELQEKIKKEKEEKNKKKEEAEKKRIEKQKQKKIEEENQNKKRAQTISNLKFKDIVNFWNEEAEKEKDYWAKIIKEINNRQNCLKKNTVEFEKNNENLNIIEKIGKQKALSKEEISKKKEITQLLEDMNAMGEIIKEEIHSDKKKCPDKFISEKEIINQESDEQLLALGIFSKALENQGIVTAIQKETQGEDKTTNQTILQFLVNGASDKAKYNLHFDFGEENNKKLLNDEAKRKKFHEKLRKKLSKEYNISEDEIIITFPRKGSYQVTVIFMSIDFELKKEDLIEKFKNEKDELGKLKDVEKGLIIEGCKLSKNHLDYRGNNRDPCWAGFGEKRGNEEYIPPIGWTGYGLKVLDVYEDNKWLGMSNSEGEWCVAYHGVGRFYSSEDVIRTVGLIYEGGFKPTDWGKCTDDDDIRHKGEKCGLGVYCSPDIKYAEGYAGVTEFNKKKYKVVLMLRVNPQKIRQSKSYPKEYILNPLREEIRPYRILLKEV